jgi:hypothetical protein
VIGARADVVRLEQQEVVEVEGLGLRLRARALQREAEQALRLRLRQVEAEQHHVRAGDRVHGEAAARGRAAHGS